MNPRSKTGSGRSEIAVLQHQWQNMVIDSVNYAAAIYETDSRTFVDKKLKSQSLRRFWARAQQKRILPIYTCMEALRSIRTNCRPNDFPHHPQKQIIAEQLRGLVVALENAKPSRNMTQ